MIARFFGTGQPEAGGPFLRHRRVPARTRRYSQYMDLTAIVTPGAQSLVTSILTDTWGQARTVLARLWSDHRPGPVARDGDQVGRDLEAAREKALEIAGQGTLEQRTERMQLFWTEFLLRRLAERPDLAAQLAALPAALANPGTAGRCGDVRIVAQTVSGTVHGGAVLAEKVSGGVHFGAAK